MPDVADGPARRARFWLGQMAARRAGGSDAELRDRACVVGLASAEVCEGNDRGANHEGGDKDGCEPARPATQFERLSL